MLKQKLDTFFKKYVGYAERHPLTILLFAFLLVLLCLYPISKIRLDGDLDDLLPKNTPTILAMEETNKRYGSADLFTIAIQMDDVEALASIQDEIKQIMEKEWDDVLYVQVQRDNSFFVKNALLYLPLNHLENIESNLSEIQLELGMNKTLFGVDLLSGTDEKDEPGEKKTREWFDASIPQELGLPDEAAQAFASFFKTSEKKPKESSPKKFIPDSLKNRLMGVHHDGTINAVVQAALKYPSSDTKYVSQVVERTEKMLDPIRKRYGPELDIGIEGPYRGLREVKSLQLNGIIATSISIVLIAFVILFFFRSLGALITILFQVAISCIYTMGITGVIYGRLNLYTVFVIAILLGMGIDYSIHIMGHAQKDAQKGNSWKDALTATLQTLIHPLALAAITTVAGLLTLLSAKFVGFYEFGVIASIGVVLSLLSSIFLLPAFIFLFEKGRNTPLVKYLSLPTRPVTSRIAWSAINWPRKLWLATCVLLVASLPMIFFCFRAGFEHDFKNLRDTRQGEESKRHVGVAVQSNRKSSQPVVALADDPETMVALHDTLLHRLSVEKDTLLRSFLTLSTFVPPLERQEERLEVVEEISDLVSARVFDRAKGRDSAMIQKLRSMVEVESFGSKDIPPWALRLVQERDGSFGKIAFIYGSFRSSDSREAGKFQDRYGHFTLNGEKLKLYSSAFIYSDIIRMVKEDSGKMAWLISAIIVLTLALTLRNWRMILISVICLAGGALWTVGTMGLLGVKLGPFNLIVVPTILGVSVDSIIHLALGYRRYGQRGLPELFTNTGTLVTASVVTTIAGYAGMLFVSHQGIQSIGQFALVGFSACLLIAIIVTPWLCLGLKADT